MVLALVSIGRHEQRPSELGEWALIEEWEEPARGKPAVLRLDGPNDGQVRAVLGLLLDGSVISVALLDRLPDPDRRWLAYEFHGAVVTSLTVRPAVLRDGGWRMQDLDGYLVWQRPTEPDPAREPFGAAVFSSQPRSVEVPVDIDLADASVFGRLAADQLGGSSALMALSGARPGGPRVHLRNLAALELDVITTPDSLSTMVAAGEIGAAVVGASSGTRSHSMDLGEFQDADAARRVWEDEPHAAGYWLLIQAWALVDPPVAVPPGHIYEQRSVNGGQTLGASTGTSFVVKPGPPVTVVIPAWCLNQSLSPPSGQALRATPLQVRYPAGTGRGQVWEDRNRLMGR